MSPIPGGGGVLQISNDGEVQRIFWDLKFTISGFFGGGLVYFGPGDVFGFCFKPKGFLGGLIYVPIRTSPSLEFQSNSLGHPDYAGVRSKLC